MAFNPNHLQTLTESGIDPLVAEHYGIRSINAPEELPEGCESFHRHIPGLLFPLPDINGDKLYQIRADTPPPGADGKTGGKYTTPDGAPTQLILWPAAKAVLDSQNYTKVLIVEGTKQSLAATMYAPKGVLVVGITGCWGWKNSASDTGIVEGLDEIVDGRLTVVCFDADIKTNQKVNDAAHALDKTLRTCGATTIKWLMLPDGGKAGLDDYLGKVLTNLRAKQLSALMAKGLTQVPRFVEPGEVSTLILAETRMLHQLSWTFAISNTLGCYPCCVIIRYPALHISILPRISRALVIIDGSQSKDEMSARRGHRTLSSDYRNRISSVDAVNTDSIERWIDHIFHFSEKGL